ncbi:MAG: glutamyl-tRNA reductase [bacterium]|nr:glutamyl-tRNA reductase [bacterium]
MADEILEIALVGLNHKTAPVETRECFSIEPDELSGFYEKLSDTGIEEAVYVSTCNRVEIYIAVDDSQEGIKKIISILEEYTGIAFDNFDNSIYIKHSEEAVKHLLTVASSLDSMVVGESEIVGQLKHCYTVSVETKRSGPFLNKLFHQAFHTAKQVRTETDITRNPLSIAYIATELVRKIFSDIPERTALLIGAGEMGELILKYLTKYKIGDITIANRSIHNSERISEEHNLDANIVLLEEIERIAYDVDIIISSVAAPHHMVTVDMAQDIMEKRGEHPIFMIDIAVPRNIDPDVSQVPGVHLYNIDDLKSIADENLSNRLKEVELAKVFIDSNAKDFFKWYDELTVAPTIVTIQNKFNEIRKTEIERYRRRKLKHLSDEDFAAIEELTRQIMTKTLHNPIMNLKRHHESSRGDVPKFERIRKKTKFVEELFVK